MADLSSRLPALLAVIPVLCLAPPVYGQQAAVPSCGWTAGMSEEEGGLAMVAASCAPDAITLPAMRLYCGEQAGIFFSAGTPLSDEFQELDAQTQFTFAAGERRVTRLFQFQEMDLTYGINVEPDDALITLLRQASRVTITDEFGAYESLVVDLTGSDVAIGELLAGCP